MSGDSIDEIEIYKMFNKKYYAVYRPHDENVLCHYVGTNTNGQEFTERDLVWVHIDGINGERTTVLPMTEKEINLLYEEFDKMQNYDHMPIRDMINAAKIKLVYPRLSVTPNGCELYFSEML